MENNNDLSLLAAKICAHPIFKNRFAYKGRILPPRIVIRESDDFNACAFENARRDFVELNSCVAESEYVEFVLAHEIGHHYRRYSLVNLLPLVAALSLFGLILILSLMHVAFFSFFFAIPFVFFVVKAWATRVEEFAADRIAARVVSKEKAIAALEKLNESTYNSLFSSHPTKSARITAIYDIHKS